MGLSPIRLGSTDCSGTRSVASCAYFGGVYGISWFGERDEAGGGVGDGRTSRVDGVVRWSSVGMKFFNSGCKLIGLSVSSESMRLVIS